MPKITMCSLRKFFVVAFVVVSAPVFASAQRTFVASTGNDANPCSIAAPCRGFARAITQTSAGGEVIVLDSAGYGAVAVTQSVSIIAPAGIYAGISVFSGDGVTISAGPTDKVVLRGLTIGGQGGNNGIHVTSGKETHIEDCVVANLTQFGVLINGGAAVHIARTVVRSNVVHGVFVQPSAAIAITVTLTDSVVTNNFAGFVAYAQIAGSAIDATIIRVTASNNVQSGFVANTGPGGSTTIVVADSIAADNLGAGVVADDANVTVMISGSSFVRNGFDIMQGNGGVLRTAGNNAVTGRGAIDIFGTLTANPLK